MLICAVLQVFQVVFDISHVFHDVSLAEPYDPPRIRLPSGLSLSLSRVYNSDHSTVARRAIDHEQTIDPLHLPFIAESEFIHETTFPCHALLDPVHRSNIQR